MVRTLIKSSDMILSKVLHQVGVRTAVRVALADHLPAEGKVKQHYPEYSESKNDILCVKLIFARASTRLERLESEYIT